MIRIMIFIPVVAILLGCSQVTRSDDPAAQVVETPVASSEGPTIQVEGPAAQADSQRP